MTLILGEGLADMETEHNSNEKTIGVNEQVFMGALGIRLSKPRLKLLRQKAQIALSFEEFVNNVLPQFTGKRNYEDYNSLSLIHI